MPLTHSEAKAKLVFVVDGDVSISTDAAGMKTKERESMGVVTIEENDGRELVRGEVGDSSEDIYIYIYRTSYFPMSRM